MTNTRYEKRKIMLLVGMLMMILMSFAKPCMVTHANGLGAGAEASTGGSSDTDTGVPELDDAMGRADKMGNGSIKFIGRWVAIIALLFFLISFPSHQSEMRIIAFIGFVVGIAMYFGPEIIDKLLGRNQSEK